MRIMEPLAILPYLYIFIVGYNKNIHGTILLLAFAFATYLYILGAGFHTASNMFKNAVESEMNDDQMDEYIKKMISQKLVGNTVPKPTKKAVEVKQISATARAKSLLERLKKKQVEVVDDFDDDEDY